MVHCITDAIMMLYVNSCPVIYTRKLILITACWTEWFVYSVIQHSECSMIAQGFTSNSLLYEFREMTWMPPEEFCLEQWINLKWYIFIILILLINRSPSFLDSSLQLDFYLTSGVRDQIKSEDVYTCGIFCGGFSRCILSY